MRHVSYALAGQVKSLLLVSFLMMGLGAEIQPVQALDIELDTSGIEETICDAIDGPEDEGVFQCDTDEASNFTDFEGDFSPPSEDGYAEGITTTSSAREFVVNVTNFVLSFLGLAAIVVIIYGGFMYVTAAGEQEKADKGKKSVTYAVIGIVIVLISYALVNTLIQGAAGGSDVTSSGGLYNSGNVTGESLTEFESAAMAGDVRDVAELFLNEYTAFVNVGAILEAMADVGTFDDNGLEEMDEGLQLILNEIDTFSETADLVREAQQLINGYLSFQWFETLKVLAGVSEWGQANMLLALESVEAPTMDSMDSSGGSADGSGSSGGEDDGGVPPPDTSGGGGGSGGGDDEGEDGSGGGSDGGESESSSEVDPYGVGGDFISAMASISNQSMLDFRSNVEAMSQQLQTMQGSFEDLESINLLFDEAIAAMESYSNESYDTRTYSFSGVSGTNSATIYVTPPGGSSHAADIIEALNQIYAAIGDLEFTTAVINANTDEGNAPLIVTFDGLDSYDPSDQTIPSENYQWDLLGDGFNGGEDDQAGPTVTYTYTETGTYRVALRVVSNDPDIAAGISYLNVKVSAPSSIISLDATPSIGSATDLSEVTMLTLTQEQGKSGILFDGSETTDGQGNLGAIIGCSFSFGDGDSESGESCQSTHYYLNEGTFDFVLEVTDQNGVKDRKIVKVVISSPAAHLSASSESVEIGETVTFDGSGSMTDNGKVELYGWQISKNGTVVDSEEGDSDEWAYAFESPGAYTVTLTVTDSAGEVNSVTREVEVVSQPPVPVILSSQPDDTHPNRMVFDARQSYDPDPGDTELLTYEWVIGGSEGTDYDFVDGYSATDAVTQVDFYEEGSWTVKLVATDPYEGDLQQTASTTETVKIDSVLTIESAYVGDGYAILDESGQAEISLQVLSSTGVSFEVDWRDGSSTEVVPVSVVGTPVTLTHTYSAAQLYSVKLVVYDEDGESNQKNHNLYIGAGDTPIPLVSITADGLDQSSETVVEGNRATTFEFDASESVDLNGRVIADAESYNWNFGDGTLVNGQRKVTKKYTDIGTYEVTLTVTSVEDPSAVATLSFTVNVESVSPEIYTLTADPLDNDLVTPLQVSVEVNAGDADSNDQLSQYRFWYYDTNNSAEQLGMTITDVPYATLTVNTNGDTGEVNEYGFAVEVFDMENNSTVSSEDLAETAIPTLEVENGPNQAPISVFSVDRNSIVLGESVTFSASAYDPDGEIVEYIWDFEGDGFYNNSATDETTLTYTYEESAPTGIEVRLKVVDEGGATGVSDAIRIYVDSLSDEPEAAFTHVADQLEVTFTNNSITDTENGATVSSYRWDFDTSTDSNGNGVKDDDTNSTEANPVYTYEDYGTYTVSLTVIDSEGNEDEVTQTLTLVATDPPEAAFTAQAEGLTVTFNNTSSVEGEGLSITSYSWDFDTGTDSDGNGNKKDDVDSTEASPSHTYDDYATYNVQLTVTDSLGRTDDVTQSLALVMPEEELIAYLTSSPEASQSDGKIHLTGTSGNVTFTFSSSGTTGATSYCLDKNVYFDSDGDGDKDNDCNHSATAADSYTTDFDESWGMIVVKLTVTDDSDRSDTVTMEVKFDESSAATSVLPVTNAEAIYILATAMVFTLLGAKLYTGRSKENVSD